MPSTIELVLKLNTADAVSSIANLTKSFDKMLTPATGAVNVSKVAESARLEFDTMAKSAQSALGKQEQIVAGLVLAGKQTAPEFAAAKKELERTALEAAKVQSALNEAKKVTQSVAESVKGASESAGVFSKSFAAVLKADALTGVMNSISGSVNSLAGGFIQLDTATAKIRTLGGPARELAGEFRGIALSMAKDFPLSAAELQTSTYDALSAGINASKKDIEAFMSASAKLAVGGSETIGNSVNLLSSVLNAYGDQATKASEYSDILFTTVNLGKTTIPELNASLSNVVPTAAAAGVSLKNVGASLALMTANGVPTAQSTTKLNQLLIELQKPGEKLAPILRAAGVSLDSLKKEDLPANLERVKKALADAGTEATNVFSSSEAGAAFNVLTKDVDKLKSTLDSFNSGAGSTSAAFEEMQKSIEVRVKQSKASFDSFITSAISGMGDIGVWVSLGAQSFVQYSSSITAALQITQVAPTAFNAMRVAMMSVPPVAKLVEFAMQNTWKAVLGGGAVAAGIAAVYMGFKYAYDNVEVFRKAVDATFNYIIDTASKVWQSVRDTIGSLASALGFSADDKKAAQEQGKKAAETAVQSAQATADQQPVQLNVKAKADDLLSDFKKSATTASQALFDQKKKIVADFLKDQQQAGKLSEKEFDTYSKRLEAIEDARKKKSSPEKDAEKKAKELAESLKIELEKLSIQQKQNEQTERAKRLADGRIDLNSEEQKKREADKLALLQAQYNQYVKIYAITGSGNNISIGAKLSTDKAKDAELKKEIIEKVRALNVQIADAENDAVELGIRIKKTDEDAAKRTIETLRKDLSEVDKTLAGINASVSRSMDEAFGSLRGSLSGLFGGVGVGVADSARFALNTMTALSADAQAIRKADNEKKLADLKAQNDKEIAILKKAEAEKLITAKEAQEKREALDAGYNATKQQIEEEGLNQTLSYISQGLGVAKTLFAEQTAAYKAMAISQALINTYAAAVAALAPPPVGAGPIFGIPLAAITVAAGLANVAKIAGFRKGGYTGDGGADDTAGVVHKGEFVFTKDMTRRNREHFEKMHKEKLSMEQYAERYLRVSEYGIINLNSRTDTRGIEQRLDTMIARLERVESAQLRSAKRFESLSKVEVKNEVVIKDKRRAKI